jgi:nitrite reductase/ring-hydroxylating ferredoxin subunit
MEQDKPMTKRVKIAVVKDLPPGQASAFDIEGKRIAVFNVGGAYYAIDDTCPHAGAPLCEGSVAGTTLTCPWHGAEFDLKTGAVLSPPAFEGVGYYRVCVEGDDLILEL